VREGQRDHLYVKLVNKVYTTIEIWVSQARIAHDQEAQRNGKCSFDTSRPGL
jgi:hypothetical protein